MKEKRILIIHTHGIGDWILFSPVLKEIIAMYPNKNIDVITGLLPTEKFISEYKNLKIICKFNFKKGFLEYFKFLIRLISLKYDNVLLTAGYDYWKIQLIAFFLSRNKYVYGLLKEGRKNIFIKNPIYYNNHWHKSRINYELYNGLIGRLNIDPENILKPYIPFDGFQNGTMLDVIIHPGCDSANKYRRWPILNFKYIINELISTGKSVGVILGPSETDLINEFNEFKIFTNFQLYNNLPFHTLFQKISNYRIVLTNDSSIGHIGGGLNKSVVSIFGPADPLDTGPLGDSIKIILPQIALDCMPCVKEGGLYGCQEQTCLKSINKNLILDQIINELANYNV
jgi:ADP-heptose:LPS heptosyltransferase